MEGSHRQSMSIAIMGGLITSTLLTLLSVPVINVMVVGWQERYSARRAARKRPNGHAGRWPMATRRRR